MVAATTAVALGGGAGTAMASTTSSTNSSGTVSAQLTSYTRHDPGPARGWGSQACAEAQAAVTKDDLGILGVEGGSSFDSLSIKAAFGEVAEHFSLPAEAILAGIDGSLFTFDNAKAVYECNPGLFEGNAQTGTNIPHGSPPPWLQRIEKSRHRLQGGTSDE